MKREIKDSEILEIVERIEAKMDKIKKAGKTSSHAWAVLEKVHQKLVNLFGEVVPE